MSRRRARARPWSGWPTAPARFLCRWCWLLAALTFAVWLLAAHSLAIGAGQHGRGAGDCVPVCDGPGGSGGAHRGRGARRATGRAFKGGEALERLAHLDVVVLDKTGTLTVGRPVLRPRFDRLVGYQEDDLLRMAAAAEERSNHPLAHAIVDARTQHAASRGNRPKTCRFCPAAGSPRTWRDTMPARQRGAISASSSIPFPDNIPAREAWSDAAVDGAGSVSQSAISTRATRCGPMRQRRSLPCARGCAC